VFNAPGGNAGRHFHADVGFTAKKIIDGKSSRRDRTPRTAARSSSSVNFASIGALQLGVPMIIDTTPEQDRSRQSD
jgi:hypothetical protein